MHGWNMTTAGTPERRAAARTVTVGREQIPRWGIHLQRGFYRTVQTQVDFHTASHARTLHRSVTELSRNSIRHSRTKSGANPKRDGCFAMVETLYEKLSETMDATMK